MNDGSFVITFPSVKVYAFVGPAGTGKSQRAQMVADSLDAEFIIDDGLVIRHSTIVVGKSAKTERNQIRAIRRAIFEYEDHRQEVLAFFKRTPNASVMIIATSDEMAWKIVHKLELPDIIKMVRIEEVATPEEIARARKQRKKRGQHVIPVSHMLVRQNFAGKLVGRLRVLWRGRSPHDGEKTIVRPPFSFYGQVHIEPSAIEELVAFTVSKVPQILTVKVASVDILEEEQLSIEVEVKIAIGTKSIVDVCNTAKHNVARNIKYFCGLDVTDISVNVIGVEFING